MATSSYEQAFRAAAALSREEQLLLIEALAESTSHDRASAPSITELCGLGQEIWRGRDAQAYVDSERASWNG